MNTQETLLNNFFGPPRVPAVPGLRYLADYIDIEVEARLLAEIDANPWRTQIARRTQHFGYSYEPQGPRSQKPVKLGDLPTWLKNISQRVYQDGLIESEPINAVINEYLPGQGIAAHLDLPAFGSTVLSLSLGGAYVMDLRLAKNPTMTALPCCSSRGP